MSNWHYINIKKGQEDAAFKAIKRVFPTSSREKFFLMVKAYNNNYDNRDDAGDGSVYIQEGRSDCSSHCHYKYVEGLPITEKAMYIKIPLILSNIIGGKIL